MIIKHESIDKDTLLMTKQIYDYNVRNTSRVIDDVINYKYEEYKLNMHIPNRFSVEEFYIDGCKFYLFKNKNNINKKVVYEIHGGAYIIPLSNNNIKSAFLYSKYIDNADVLVIDYSVGLNAFPKTIKEALNGYKYLLERYDNNKIFIAGHSSGGGLALGLLLYLKDNNYKLPKKLFLATPWLDISSSGKSYKDNIKNDPIFGNFSNQKLPNLYTNDIYNKYASPIYGDYKDMPDIYIFVSDNETLLSDSLTLNDKMDNVYIHLFHGLWHEFYTHDDSFKEAKDVWQIISENTL